jgi:APA family basic amino acid/polyamine antiporter
LVSFVLTAIACGFAALCYAEFAAMVPVAGSAYTYAYATLGELVAWIIGWDLILEYAVGNVAVAISWSGYFQELLRGFGFNLAAWLGTDYRTALQAGRTGRRAQAAASDLRPWRPQRAPRAGALAGAAHRLGVRIHLQPAGLRASWHAVTWIDPVSRHPRERVGSTAWSCMKLVIIAFFLVHGRVLRQAGELDALRPERLRRASRAPRRSSSSPTSASTPSHGRRGDASESAARHADRHPRQSGHLHGDLHRGGGRADRHGAVEQLGHRRAAGDAFSSAGDELDRPASSPWARSWPRRRCCVFQIGQPRIFFSMARDGLLPAWAAKVHPRYRTPHITTWMTGVLVAAFSSVANINEMVELTNIGTLLRLRARGRGHPDPAQDRPATTAALPGTRGCRSCPSWGPSLCCGYLMFKLPAITWIWFFIWMAVGLVIYLGYGRRRSKLNSLPS